MVVEHTKKVLESSEKNFQGIFCLVASDSPDKSENIEEDVDDVKVESQS